jgi:hypothetical protein
MEYGHRVEISKFELIQHLALRLAPFAALQEVGRSFSG